MKIKYFVKNVYGKPTKYVADKDQAEAISKISMRKTLDGQIIQGLKDLGFEFEEVLNPEHKKL